MLDKSIHNIIFDLGGVIINLNQKKTFDAFKKHFGSNYAQVEAALAKKNVLNLFETGNISVDEFILFFLNFNPLTDANNIKKIWNSMLLDIPSERIKLIKKLALNYNLYLLSNTNQIHLDFINHYLHNKYGITSINSMFKKAYFSHEVGLRKPNPQLFKLVLTENELNPAATLFIDDSIEHIDSAQQLGIKTVHLIDKTLTTYFHS